MGVRSSKAGRQQYGVSREQAYLENLAAPIPRERIPILYRRDVDGRVDNENIGLADAIVRANALRQAQLQPLWLQDLRLLRYYDPEKMEDHWSNWLTGTPLSKLQTKGLAVEMYNWPQAVVEALVGLLAGHKPMPYILDVKPSDPLSDADVAHADATENYLYLERDLQDYPISYMDGCAYLVGLGRWVRMMSVHPRTKRIRTEMVWPANVAAYWQRDQRTIEQVYLRRPLLVSEVLEMYGDRGEGGRVNIDGPKSRAIIAASQPNPGRAARHIVLESDGLDPNATTTLLSCWYRMGDFGDERIGMATVLIGAEQQTRTGSTNLLLDYDDDTTMPDIPVRITPRFKTMDKTPDEATGALKQIAGVSTEFNEVVSAYRDMIWRAIYQRYVAKGFSFRNAPRLDKTFGGVIPLPRIDQDLRRLDEVLNTVPIEQVLNRLEEMIIVLPGLNRYFLGSAPPSETSGEAISAAIHASITRLEPVRNNIQRDEIWMYRQWLEYAERWGELQVHGRRMDLRELIAGNRNIELVWRDVRPREETKAKQLAMAAAQAGHISSDTVLDEWPNVLSKEEERRKIRRERQDAVLHPREYLAAAQALAGVAQARAQVRMLTAQAAAQTMPGAMPGAQGPEGAAAAMAGAERTAPRPPSFERDNRSDEGVYPPTTAESPANAGTPPA